MTHNILIVDDSATLRAAVNVTLSPPQYKVHEATNGQEGLDFLARARQTSLPIHLIISDINMPIMGGIEFIKAVKKTEDRFIPILVLTTEGEQEVKEQGRRAGAAGWLVKPFQPPMLIKVVRKFIR